MTNVEILVLAILMGLGIIYITHAIAYTALGEVFPKSVTDSIWDDDTGEKMMDDIISKTIK